jgi:hypothetical protein
MGGGKGGAEGGRRERETVREGREEREREMPAAEIREDLSTRKTLHTQEVLQCWG